MTGMIVLPATMIAPKQQIGIASMKLIVIPEMTIQ